MPLLFPDYSLNYRRLIEPPLTNADNAWAQQLLAATFPSC
jgi:hypothetical protein